MYGADVKLYTAASTTITYIHTYEKLHCERISEGVKSRKVFLHKIFFSLSPSLSLPLFSHTFFLDFSHACRAFSIVNNFNIFILLFLLIL